LGVSLNKINNRTLKKKYIAHRQYTLPH